VSLARRASAELAGTALLVMAVVGSGIAATRLSPRDGGLRLLENSVATGLALGALILMFGPVSGAHLNPVVSAVDWWYGRTSRTGLTPAELGLYVLAQTGGAVLGAVAADLMFGLVLLVFALARSGRGNAAPAAVGAYIGAAYWFTASTSFANPAVTIGRAVTDTFAGIAPASVPGFVAAQLVGGLVAIVAIRWWYPASASRRPTRELSPAGRHP
jgi:arsenate reductase